mgnify:CR=1 FL=1|tara:strand:+ start:20972 stop:21205 length:234 start_codon:yes stop_codon:yes gene_type:complete
MPAASRGELSELHNQLTEVLKEEMTTGERTPAMLNVVRQFLKDCGIEVRSDRTPTGIKELKETFDEHYVDGMPEFEN